MEIVTNKSNRNLVLLIIGLVAVVSVYICAVQTNTPQPSQQITQMEPTARRYRVTFHNNAQHIDLGYMNTDDFFSNGLLFLQSQNLKFEEHRFNTKDMLEVMTVKNNGNCYLSLDYNDSVVWDASKHFWRQYQSKGTIVQ